MTFDGSKLTHRLGFCDTAGEADDANIQGTTEHCAKRRVTKLVINRPTEGKPDRAQITAIARGTCWFEERTSGKAQSIRYIAEREGVTDRYISRVIEGALISPVNKF